MQVKKTNITPDYADDIWRSLTRHIFPKLGNYPIHQITAIATIDVIKPIAAMGRLETVKRLCQRLNEVMTFAVNTDYINANCLLGIKRAFEAPKAKHMATIKPAELPILMTAISYASIRKTTRCLLEWQLHTMTRPSKSEGT